MGTSAAPYQEPLTSRQPPGRRRRPPVWLWIVGPPLFGALVGLFLPLSLGGGSAAKEAPPWGRVSAMLGWAYFCAWSLSFYPQVVQNFRRRSVLGLSLDYQLLNLAGFACYFAFNAALYWNPRVQQEYADQHGGSTSAVRLNDVVFAGHADLITAVTLLQIAAFYDYPPLEGTERIVRGCVLTFLFFLVAGSAGLAIAIAATDEGISSWLGFFGALSEVKVLISVVKYCPQVWMNYRRQSTEGWNIANVLLDFTGGLLSVLQLLVDGWATSDWSAVTGDPAKFLLGNISMLFDLIFMVQHYCLYSGGGGGRHSPEFG
mmetsp:Transcript_125169/g.325228  ORF Transcript_125169/g.325228 Transcript_125169/m.325228 type:complete len:317 (+) Transcript_125169:56-1006(+)